MKACLRVEGEGWINEEMYNDDNYEGKMDCCLKKLLCVIVFVSF